MANKVGAVYSGFSILAFLALCVWSTHALTVTRDANIMQAANGFNAITQGIAAMQVRGEGFESAPFQRAMRSIFIQDASLETLIVRSASGEVQYVIARHASNLDGVSTAGNNWSGRIRYNSSVQKIFTAQVPLPPTVSPLLARAVITVLDRDSIYPILRVVILALIGFIILTGIVIALSSLLSREEKSGKVETEPNADHFQPASSVEPTEAPHMARAAAEQAEVAARASERNPAASETTHVQEPTAHIKEMASAQGATPPAPSYLTGSVETITVEEQAPPLEDSEVKAVPESVQSYPADAPPASIRLPSLEEVLGEPEDEESFTAVSREAELEHVTPSFETPVVIRDQVGPPTPEDAAGSAGGSPDDGPRIETIRADIPDFEVTELDKDSAADAGSARPTLRSATEELDDLPEVEDLEEIDGHRNADAIKSVEEIEALAVAPGRDSDAADVPVELELIQDLEPPPPSRPDTAQTFAAQDEPTDANPSLETAFSAKSAGPQGLFNPETGLAWDDHFEQRLTFELERAASFDQDLVLGIIRCREIAVDPQMLQKLAAQILAYFPFRDLCFEHGQGGFGVILPNTDIDQAIRTMESFQKKVADAAPSIPHFQVGLTARNGRLLGGSRMIREAESAAGRAEADRKNTIFALRVDPGKYREYIKSTLK